VKKEVELLQGSPKEYKSSKDVIRTFCEKCSSPFSYEYINTDKNHEDKGMIFIPIGVFDNPEHFKVEHHIWTSQKMPQKHTPDQASRQEK